jgi:hypothetical protein
MVWNVGDPEEPPSEFTHGRNYTFRLMNTAEKDTFMGTLHEFMEAWKTTLENGKQSGG